MLGRMLESPVVRGGWIGGGGNMLCGQILHLTERMGLPAVLYFYHGVEEAGT